MVGAAFVQLAAKQFANLFVWISFRSDSEGITGMLEENERGQELGNHRRLIMCYILVLGYLKYISFLLVNACLFFKNTKVSNEEINLIGRK